MDRMSSNFSRVSSDSSNVSYGAVSTKASNFYRIVFTSSKVSTSNVTFVS